MKRPDSTDRRPRQGNGDQEDHGGAVSTSVQAAAVKCAYLHPKHLTGCRQPAVPGSRYCADHGGAR